MISGEICKRSGLYKSSCSCVTMVTLTIGELFPKCRNCGSVRWHLVSRTKQF